MRVKKILFAGIINNYTVENSYSNCAMNLGLEVKNFDISTYENKYIKFGKVGKTMHRFLPVETWIRKMNRDLVITIKNFNPDVFVYFTTSKILYGTLATLKAINPQLKIVWIWTDTPLNLEAHNFSSGLLSDITATYSLNTVPVFKDLGFKNVSWIPLAGDVFMHKKEITKNQDYKCDISFVGGWRPERGKAMEIISNNFKHLRIEVHGPLWSKKVKDPQLKKNIKGTGFYANDLADFFNSSRININQIDDTNFPAANMRFFEIPTAGALQLTSACPEMEGTFINKKHILYYKNELELLENIQWIIDHPEESELIKNNGQELLLKNHTYTHRFQQILQYLEN